VEPKKSHNHLLTTVIATGIVATLSNDRDDVRGTALVDVDTTELVGVEIASDETTDVEEKDDVEGVADVSDAKAGLGLKPFAMTGFEDRNAEARSSIGQPSGAHGLDLQHPMNGGMLAAQVYHCHDRYHGQSSQTQFI